MSAEQVLQLQQIDTAIDQARHRRDHLPEQVAADEAGAAVVAWERRRDQLERRIGELTQAIEADEGSGAELAATRTRLQAHLKTVIAPREAEALMHEIDTIEHRRSDLDDHELAQLEEQSALDDELTAHLATEADVRAALAGAEEALAAAQEIVNSELTDLGERRDVARQQLEPSTLDSYERMRATHGGIAIARLEGSRCGGCHLDLSRGEVDEVKRAVGGDIPECPQCGRLLVP